MSVSIKTENGIIKVGDVGGGGGSDVEVVELTKAEYDALPSSKESDGKLYFVKDWEQE